MDVKKIFVSAYACEPHLGSECGVGWHWVLEMSRYYELWVLTRHSNRANIENALQEHPQAQKIHFLYYDLPDWAKFWKKGLQGVHLYYYLWQIFSNRMVKKNMRQHHIEIFHHLTYGNILLPVSHFGRKHCFIWGPLGGLETIPKSYTRYYGDKSQFLEMLRRFMVKMLPFNLMFRRNCHYANLILCKTEITRKRIPQPYQTKTVFFTDVALNISTNMLKSAPHQPQTDYLMVGRLDAWRGFDLAIESFCRVEKINPLIHLFILGKGNDVNRLAALIHQYGMEDKIHLIGEVPHEKYVAWLNDADVVINSALKEGAVTVSFDSIAQSKPLICLDTTGYTRLLRGRGAVIIPPGDRETVIRAFADAMLRLSDPAERLSLTDQLLASSSHFTWEEQGGMVKEMIDSAFLEYIQCRKNE